MVDTAHEHQLGDFIKGRMIFIEEYCRRQGLDPKKAIEEIKTEALLRAGGIERRKFLEDRLFKGAVLASSLLPDWVDGVFLEATTRVLKGPGAALSTKSSRLPCVPFEAGRFNSHRQADSIFKLYYANRTPETWFKTSFAGIYRKCYGDEAAANLVVEEIGPQKFRLTMNNRALEKAGPIDCSTIIGYIFGALEKLGVGDPLVTHESCGAGRGPTAPLCVFETSWKPKP